jgi:DNA-binding NarL/FixJ family response regulator
MGLPDKTIASRLGISERTVGNHFRSIYERLGSNSDGCDTNAGLEQVGGKAVSNLED